MSVYRGATRIQDKDGAELHVYQVTTLEVGPVGERLGWALIAARGYDDARRRARNLWPTITILDVFKGVQA
jgi:hypothetical protein